MVDHDDDEPHILEGEEAERYMEQYLSSAEGLQAEADDLVDALGNIHLGTLTGANQLQHYVGRIAVVVQHLVRVVNAEARRPDDT